MFLLFGILLFHIFALHDNSDITALLTRLLLPAHVSSDSWGFPHSSVGKESVCSAGDPGLIPGSGRSPGEGTGNPLQYSCLENPMDRGG